MNLTLCAYEGCKRGDAGGRKLFEQADGGRQIYCCLKCNQNAYAARKRADSPPIVEVEEEVDLDALQYQLAETKRINQRLNVQLARAKNRSQDLVEAVLASARDAMTAFGPYIPTAAPAHLAGGHTHNAEAAFWHLTDWQGSKETTSYNSQVMRQRVERFWKKANAITEIQRADHPVDECVIAFGGDMVEGLFNFPTQAFEIDQTIFGQFVTVSRLIVDTVRYALSVYPQVHVIGEWGNHGRMGSKRDNVPRYDNIDRMVYEMSRQLLEGEDRLTWENGAEDIQRIQVGNYKALLIHGDEVGRAGYASPMQIVNHVNGWRSGAYPWDFRDVYMGHYHTHAEWPMRNGKGHVYQTGSTESDNRYALVSMASTATPSQRLHFIDKKKGRVSAQYQVYLADELDADGVV